MRKHSNPKPEITNFRIRWDRIADLAGAAVIWGMCVWVLIIMSIAVLKF